MVPIELLYVFNAIDPVVACVCCHIITINNKIVNPNRPMLLLFVLFLCVCVAQSILNGPASAVAAVFSIYQPAPECINFFYGFIRIHNVWCLVSDKRWWWISYFVQQQHQQPQHHHQNMVYLIHLFCWCLRFFFTSPYFSSIYCILLSPLASIVQRNHKKMIWYQNQYLPQPACIFVYCVKILIYEIIFFSRFFCFPPSFYQIYHKQSIACHGMTDRVFLTIEMWRVNGAHG